MGKLYIFNKLRSKFRTPQINKLAIKNKYTTLDDTSAAEDNMTAQKTQQQIRFEKEAKALQKNLAKRKKQQQELERIKKEKEQKNGQD